LRELRISVDFVYDSFDGSNGSIVWVRVFINPISFLQKERGEMRVTKKPSSQHISCFRHPRPHRQSVLPCQDGDCHQLTTCQDLAQKARVQGLLP